MLDINEDFNGDMLTINAAFHFGFLAWLTWNILYLGVWLHPQALKDWANKKRNSFFTWHGLAVNVVLLFCAGDWWFKWVGGVALVTSLFCLMTEIPKIKDNPFSYDNLKLLFLLDCHHLGPVIAFYFQPPEHAWLNALFFGHVWWIHGKGALFDVHVKPTLTKIISATLDLEMENRECEKGYAVLTVLLSALYFSYLPFGWNYSTCAFLSQFLGRNIINDNYLNVDWMRELELPGVVSVILWSYGPAPVIFFNLLFLLHVHYRTRDKNAVKLPEKFVMTDEIRKFMADFPRKVQDVAENEQKGAWFDGNSEEWKKYVLHKHCMLGNEEEVKKLLDDGADPNMLHKLWHDSKPFAWAAASGQIGVMIILIEAGVFPFDPEWKKSARMFKAENVVRFLEELVPLTYKALRSDLRIQYERVEAPGLTHKMSVELAKEKGGRLCTNDEILEFLMGTALFPKQDQWVASFDHGERDWVQIGNKYHEPGTQHVKKWDTYPSWGDNLDDETYGKPTWQRFLFWKVEAEEEKDEVMPPTKTFVE